MRLHPFGYSLLEGLYVLAIAAITTSLAVPSFTHLQASQRRDTSVRQVISLLNHARSLAATRNEIITFCASNDDSTCDKDASGAFIVFADADENHAATADEILLQETARVPGTLFRLSASAGRNYLRFRPTGTVVEWGSIVVCPADADRTYASRLAISNTGRIRHGRDKDGDGIVEDRDGNSIDCGEL